MKKLLLLSILFFCVSVPAFSVVKRTIVLDDGDAQAFDDLLKDFKSVDEIEEEGSASDFGAVGAPKKKSVRKPFFRISLHTRISRKFSFPIGASFDFVFVKNKFFHTYAYLRGEYFLEPLGSGTGRLATMEIEGEPGIGLAFTPLRETTFRLLFSLEFGYYFQFMMFNGNNGTLAIIYNGIMARPMLSVETFRLFRRYTEFGLFYQLTFLNEYSDYNSLGVFVRL